MQPFDIFQAEHEFKDCHDPRPWLVIRPANTDGLVACFPISGEDYSGRAYQIRKEHPDFNATGLNKTCYIHDESSYDVPIAAFKKHRGALTNKLLGEFKAHAGF